MPVLMASFSLSANDGTKGSCLATVHKVPAGTRVKTVEKTRYKTVEKREPTMRRKDLERDLEKDLEKNRVKNCKSRPQFAGKF